jgi:hypothetical protein
MTNRHTVFLAVVITFFFTSIAWLGTGYVAYHFYTSPPPRFDVVIEHPDIVELGDEFPLKITVKNQGGGAPDLGTIDVYHELLDGFEILAVTPKPDATERSSDCIIYHCRAASRPSSEFTFTLTLKAKEAGDWGGDVDCWTPLYSVLSNYIEISVVEP